MVKDIAGNAIPAGKESAVFAGPASLTPFSKYEGVLALFYDLDHAWRPYEAQARLVAGLFKNPSQTRMLDFCCGSGTHALSLAQKGFQVTGLDASAALLSLARRKTEEGGFAVPFKKRDVFSPRTGRELQNRYHGAYLLGWTLNMAPIWDHFKNILKNAEAALLPGGLFIFDCAMGENVNPVQRKALKYEVSPELSGKLTIQKMEKSSNSQSFVYNWEILGRGEKLYVSTQEELSILSLKDILSALRNFQDRFEIKALLGDYDSRKPFAASHKNLVVVLKKRV